MAVIVTINVGGFDYGFDFEDQRIDVDSGLDIVSVINLYAAIKDAQDEEAAMPYRRIADASGLDELSAGITTFLTVRLLDSWEVNTLKTSGRFVILDGNLIRADGEDPFRDNPLITYQLNLSQAGVVAETGVSGLTPTESTQLGNLDVAVSSRLATASYTAPPTAAAISAETWEGAALESTLTPGDMMRIMSAVLAGSAVVPNGDGSYSFTGLDGATVRVGGTVTGTARANTLIDGT
jgi:hypothetical protein